MDMVTDIFTILTALVNIFLVYRVFKFTQKMSQSKLSLSPEVIHESDSTSHSETITKFNTNLEYSEEGFPLRKRYTSEDRRILYIKVKNRGDLPSTKIKIQLKLKVYKTEITDIIKHDEWEKIKHKRKLHEIVDVDINIDYMGADEEQLYRITALYGQVRELEVLLTGIHSSGHTYFKGTLSEPTIIYQYEHPNLPNAELKYDDGKALYGHSKEWEDFNERMQKYQNRIRTEVEEMEEEMLNGVFTEVDDLLERQYRKEREEDLEWEKRYFGERGF